MKVFELTSGFIAAVLIALGAYQYVNKTTVEEEPVVKENVVLTPQWYKYDGPARGQPGYAPTDASQYIPYTDPGDPDCDGGNQVCAVKLTPGIDPEHPDQGELSALSDEIEDEENVEDLLMFELQQ